MEQTILKKDSRIFLDKWMELNELRQDSKVLLTSGETATFIKLNKKNFVGIMDGKTFNIPIELFDKVLEVAKLNDGYKKLKKGEAFYISNGKDALLFIFEAMEKGKIIGINPISSSRTRIAVSMYAGKVSEVINNMKK